MVPELFIALVVGYALGAIPFAVIIARAKGVDIFKVGSGNPGATNVKRALGRKAGNLCFALDCLKGIVATAWMLPFIEDPNLRSGMSAIALGGAAFGHSYSPFLRFRGGKGVAVTMGGLAVALPNVLIGGLLIWAAFFGATRVVSLASIAFAVSLPLFAWLMPDAWFFGGVVPPVALIAALFIFLLILLRHLPNIKRLFSGKELSFKNKPNEK